jgi:hypothetical protein
MVDRRGVVSIRAPDAITRDTADLLARNAPRIAERVVRSAGALVLRYPGD